MKQTRSLSELSSLSELTRLYLLDLILVRCNENILVSGVIDPLKPGASKIALSHHGAV